MMTLGPAIMLLPVFERARGWFATFFDTIGRVPFFYVRTSTLSMPGESRSSREHPSAFVTNPFFSIRRPGVRVPVIYGIWVLTVLLLYPACRWFAGVKARRRDLWWLGYL